MGWNLPWALVKTANRDDVEDAKQSQMSAAVEQEGMWMWDHPLLRPRAAQRVFPLEIFLLS